MVLPPLLTVTTERRRDGVIIHARGEVDHTTARHLDTITTRAIDTATAPMTVTLDLTAVTYFGSAGIAVLVKAKCRCHNRHTPLIVQPSPAVHRILRITGLNETITIRN